MKAFMIPNKRTLDDVFGGDVPLPHSKRKSRSESVTRTRILHSHLPPRDSGLRGRRNLDGSRTRRYPRQARCQDGVHSLVLVPLRKGEMMNVLSQGVMLLKTGVQRGVKGCRKVVACAPSVSRFLRSQVKAILVPSTSICKAKAVSNQREKRHTTCVWERLRRAPTIRTPIRA
jgi:hypothetical protein